MKTWAGNFTLGISSLMHTLGIRVPTPQGSSEDKRGNAGPSPTYSNCIPEKGHGSVLYMMHHPRGGLFLI